MSLKPLVFSALLLGVGASAHAADAGLLHALFQDHAVVQRDAPIPVWGHARSNAAVRLDFAGKSVKTKADGNGDWHARLPAQQAGGPYALRASSDGATQTIGDVLVGDVWLCSGQSNMELQVKRTLNSRAEILGANNDRIRMLKVPQVGTPSPQYGFGEKTEWQKTTPDTVGEFSAACYYFARELQKSENVPMGLVNASLGGSRIEAWLNDAQLRKFPGNDDALDVLAQYAKDPQAANAQWGALWAKWWTALPDAAKADAPVDDEPWQSTSTAGWHDAPRALGNYQAWGVADIAHFTGMLWYRTHVALTAAQAAQAATLSIGNADEIDETFVNGRGVGSLYGGVPRDYALPAGSLHAGDNLVAINVLNTYMEGGLVGDAATRTLKFADRTSIALDAGGWQYRKVPTAAGTPPLAPWLSASGKSTLYNGMIAPLGNYALRGALWYQGESNTGNASAYRAQLGALRDEFRAQFGANLPLFVVQLANFGAAPTQPTESGSAEVREAQRLAVQDDARSALAVAIDIGERGDIHPANKQELGRRLARAAKHVVYGDSAPATGPTLASARRDGDDVVVAFNDVTGKLRTYGADFALGFELCGDAKGSCRYAQAQLRNGNQVVLHAAAANATRVRYAWADSPVVNLFDDAGLPAGPFQIEIK